MTDKKWREFWIEYSPDKSHLHYVDEKPIQPEIYGEWKNIYRVIQIEAYQELTEQNTKLQAALEVAMGALKHPWLLEELSCECGYYGDDTEEQGISICQKCTIESALVKIEELLK